MHAYIHTCMCAHTNTWKFWTFVVTIIEGPNLPTNIGQSLLVIMSSLEHLFYESCNEHYTRGYFLGLKYAVGPRILILISQKHHRNGFRVYICKLSKMMITMMMMIIIISRAKNHIFNFNWRNICIHAYISSVNHQYLNIDMNQSFIAFKNLTWMIRIHEKSCSKIKPTWITNVMIQCYITRWENNN